VLSRISTGSDASARGSARIRSIALATAGTGGIIAALILLAASALPRGMRRRWRAGLVVPQLVESEQRN
jgi:hypothetical protein